MLRIVVLTPTYKRIGDLRNLFDSLNHQTSYDFIWVIVDDGSPMDLKPTIDLMRKSSKFPISYYKKSNGGKSSAINYALDLLNENDFVIVIDDDEILYENAITIVSEYAAKYQNTNIGMIDFNRAYSNGTIMANPIFEEDYIMTVQERRKKGISSDGYTGYYLSKVGKTRFPIYEGEKYVGPSVLSMLVSINYDIMWATPILGHTEYQNEGLTRQGRILRIKNPRSMAFYCLLMQAHESGFCVKFTYSILYFAYLNYAHIYDFKTDIHYSTSLRVISKPLGKVLSLYWKWKYN